ncbi:hypothetical protein, partial [Psychroflexus sp. MES1-P1E]|uniref:hypothetical protein n=1 Tax=Psychroflexus sp. MES1-P1E TaxID=2058320 RepID=UPI000CAAAB98
MKINHLLSFKGILLFILLNNLYQGFAQQPEIPKLESKKIEIQNMINFLNDSIVKIDREIKKLEMSEFNKVVYDTTALKINITNGAKLREKPDAFSDLIIELNSDKTVYLYDFENDYYKVCADSFCG